MLIAAVGVGLLAAYYFGIQVGIWAAAAAAALVLLTMIPGLSLYAYIALGVGVGGIAWLGPKLRRPASPASFVTLGRAAARRYTDKLFSNKRR